MASLPRDGALEGARKLVATCLGLQKGDDFLIITDEKTYRVALLIEAQAMDLGISAGIMLVPIRDQIACSTRGSLPAPVRNALRGVHAALTCVCDLPEAKPFRSAIIDEVHASDTKIGNCPGINIQMLTSAINVDYERMTNLCNLLARTLILGENAEITTRDADGHSVSLSMKLARLNRVPIASTGIIPKGLWGNIPSGETFLAPIEGTAEGEIIIDGSLPGCALSLGQALRLEFGGGALRSIQPTGNKGAVILSELLQRALSAGDTGAHQLGELGIGANPRVRQLTGHALLDEKKVGTVHIALGDNTHFNGQNNSRLHLDLVTRHPSLNVDGKEILRRGVLVIDEAEWLPNYRTYPIRPEDYETLSIVRWTGHEVDGDRRSGLRRKLIDDVGPGRSLTVPVGDSATAQRAYRIHRALRSAEPVAYADLLAGLPWPAEEVLIILSIMQYYGLVVLLNNQGHHLP